MAFIVSSDERTFTIDKFLGLNESPDGDTNLKPGEAAVMQNWRVTSDGNLRIRPGYKSLLTIAAGHPVRCLWTGYIDETLYLIAACNGHVWNVYGLTTAVDLGTLTDDVTTMFGYSGKLYILNGHEYKVWTGTGSIAEVSGYAPLIATATPPAGGGTLLQPINLLTGVKRQRFSPTAVTSTVFHLLETDVDSIDSVTDNGTAVTGFTYDLTAGTVTFTPSISGVPDSVEIKWTKASADNRAIVTAMKYAEVYGGINDSRVFIYGDGTHKTFYSGLDYDGVPSAEYFPVTYEMAVGAENTPITGMCRQYDRLTIFKPDSTFYAQSYATLSDASGAVVVAFTVLPLNSAIGNEAVGQVRLIENNPVSLCRNAAFEWKSTQIRDERMARRISDRANASLSAFTLSSTLAFENDRDREHWIVYGSDAVIHNYETDTWYVYSNLPVTALVSHAGKTLMGLPDGRLCEYSQAYRNDSGTAISARWESGSYGLGADYQKKFANYLYVTLRPETFASVDVSVMTNSATSEPQEKTITYNLATFVRANFANWSFKTGRRPQTKRIKMKLKNFAFFRLIFSSDSDYTTANILSANVIVRFGGNVKTR